MLASSSILAGIGLLLVGPTLVSKALPGVGPASAPPLVVLAQNDLGMHCMQQDSSEILVLPPYNNLHAQVIDRTGEHPHIVTSGVTVRYTIPGNTHSADKSNFWRYAKAYFGVDLAPDVGLTGNGLSGVMKASTRDYAATGIPITPTDDDGKENPYPLATVSVERSGAVVTSTQAVVPVSWEMNCNLCHQTPGITLGQDVLRAHDRLHGTDLAGRTPVLCAECHADPALGAPGKPGVSTLSAAMHGAHAPRMDAISLENKCYACHPGTRTTCLRDVHVIKQGMTCVSCHGGMEAVGDPARRPWQDLPRCDTCHTRSGFEFEQPGVLFKEAVGHGGVKCLSCHGSPHAITPTTTEVDNAQAVRLQGFAGVISECAVCHETPPHDPFFHKRDD